MWKWIKQLFGGSAAGAVARPAPALPEGRRPESGRAAPARGPAGLPPEATPFLQGLLAEAEPRDLQTLPPDDRVFLSGILKRLREGRFEIPVLPKAAVEFSRLLANPRSAVKDFVRVLSADPALSVEILRMANSAYYGFGSPAPSVREAVVRVGLNQVRGLVLLSHARGRVLQGGGFKRESQWLSDVSMAVASAGRLLAGDLRLDPEAASTRGLLMHLEHFAILGSVAEVSADHRRPILPSSDAALEGFRRFGGRVRDLVGKAWDLGDLLRNETEGEGDGFVPLWRAVVTRLGGGEGGTFAVPGVSPARLSEVLDRVCGAR